MSGSMHRPPMSHFRHTFVTHLRGARGYGVCRGPGDPLGAVAEGCA
jgi:hypothetical protein